MQLDTSYVVNFLCLERIQRFESHFKLLMLKVVVSAGKLRNPNPRKSGNEPDDHGVKALKEVRG